MGSLVVLALVVAGIAFVVGGSGGGDESSDALAVELVAASDRGDDAFTEVLDPVAVKGFSTASSGSAGASGSERASGSLRLASTEGTSSGLYGSTGETAPCDFQALADGLLADDGVAATWSDLFGIEPEEIEATLARLTPVVLGRDTFVTNTSYKVGKARRFPAILQSGTRVLVDAAGVPRVKCSCGNPLAAPPADRGEVVLKGDPWEGFDRARITLVDPKSEPADEIETIDVDSRDRVRLSTGAVLALDGYLANDANGVTVVSEDGETRTTVIDHEVAAVFDDGQGGLIYQDRRSGPDGGAGYGTLLAVAPPDEDEGTIWHLPAGASSAVPLVEPDLRAAHWPVLEGAGRFDGKVVVVYDAVHNEPIGCCSADLVVRDAATGEDHVLLADAWAGADASIATLDVNDDHIAWTAYGYLPFWHSVDADLAPADIFCVQAGESPPEECAGPQGAVDGAWQAAELHNESSTTALAFVDLLTNVEHSRTTDLGSSTAEDLDRATLDAHEGRLLMSFVADGGPPKGALLYDLDGEANQAPVELPITGAVRFLRSPLLRPISTVSTPAPTRTTTAATTTTAAPTTTLPPEPELQYFDYSEDLVNAFVEAWLTGDPNAFDTLPVNNEPARSLGPPPARDWMTFCDTDETHCQVEFGENLPDHFVGMGYYDFYLEMGDITGWNITDIVPA